MPTFSRAAISLSADATSSACARLSSWHGPAMIEIGSALPNLTAPTETTGAAVMSAFKVFSLHRRECGRHQQLADDIADDLAVCLARRARGNPVRIGLERGPFLLAVSERIPRQHVSQFLIGFADQRGEKTRRPDAVLLPQLERNRFKALQQRRQPARQAAIDTHLVDHRFPPFLARRL